MCDICLRTPCDSRCPNADDPPIVCKCEVCEEPIYEGDLFYHIGDHKFCESCGRGGLTVAEME